MVCEWCLNPFAHFFLLVRRKIDFRGASMSDVTDALAVLYRERARVLIFGLTGRTGSERHGVKSFFIAFAIKFRSAKP